MAKRKQKRPVAAIDLDGSLIREQLLVLLTQECIDLEIFRRVVDVLFRELRLKQRDRLVTFPDYDAELIALFIARVKGKLRSDIDVAARHVYEKHRDWLYCFTKALIAELKTSHQLITITGAMVEVVEKLGPYWGFEHHYSTEMAIDDLGRYTGHEKAVPVREKGKALREHVATHDATFEGSVSLGDTESDIAMLEAVEIPIAFNPKGKLRQVARERGWPIVMERADGIYVLHGGHYELFDSGDAVAAVRYVLNLPKPTK